MTHHLCVAGDWHTVGIQIYLSWPFIISKSMISVGNQSIFSSINGLGLYFIQFTQVSLAPLSCLEMIIATFVWVPDWVSAEHVLRWEIMTANIFLSQTLGWGWEGNDSSFHPRRLLAEALPPPATTLWFSLSENNWLLKVVLKFDKNSQI